MSDFCIHCGDETKEGERLELAHCGHQDDTPHCEAHRIECEDCGDYFCTLLYEVKESEEDGLFRCSVCREKLLEFHPLPKPIEGGDEQYKENWT